MKAIKGVPVLMFVSLAMVVSLFASPLSAASSKDVIVVLDTSYTMEGYGGGKKIFSDVKDSIKRFIDKEVKDGDTLTFISFDESVKVYPSVRIDDINDRNIVKGYISMTEAQGKWTYTAKMLAEAFKTAEELEKKSKKEGKQTLLVIMTDGIDDPPPGSPRHININEVTKAFQGHNNWWIHYVSFVDFKKNQKALDKLKGLLEKVGPTEMQKGGDNGKMDIDRKNRPKEESWFKKYGIYLLLGLGVLFALFILGVIIYRIISSIVVKGKLEYWSNEVIEPYIMTYDLGRKQLREIMIGKSAGCALYIRDINISSPFGIRAARVKGKIRLQLLAPEGSGVEMVNREAGGFIEDGDIFKANNYTFKYYAPSKE